MGDVGYDFLPFFFVTAVAITMAIMARRLRQRHVHGAGLPAQLDVAHAQGRGAGLGPPQELGVQRDGVRLGLGGQRGAEVQRRAPQQHRGHDAAVGNAADAPGLVEGGVVGVAADLPYGGGGIKGRWNSGCCYCWPLDWHVLFGEGEGEWVLVAFYVWF